MKYAILVILSVVAIIGALFMTGNMPAQVLEVDAVDQATVATESPSEVVSTASNAAGSSDTQKT